MPNISVALDGSLPADSPEVENFRSSNGDLGESMSCTPSFQNELLILEFKLTSQYLDSKALTLYDPQTIQQQKNKNSSN